MSAAEWALASVVFLAGGFVKGAIGFGLPLFIIPFLSLFIGPRDAVVTVSIPILLTNLANVHLGRKEWGALREVVPYFVLGVATVPVGVLFLHWGDPETVRLLIGLAVYGYLAVRGFLPSMGARPPATRRGVGAGLGALAGFLTGMASIPGPVTIVYFSMFSWTKEVFIFLINAFNAVVSGGLVSTLAARGAYTPPTLLRTAAAMVPIFGGFWVGLRLRRRLRPEVFFRVVRVALFCIASGLVGRALWNFVFSSFVSSKSAKIFWTSSFGSLY